MAQNDIDFENLYTDTFKYVLNYLLDAEFDPDREYVSFNRASFKELLNAFKEDIIFNQEEY